MLLECHICKAKVDAEVVAEHIDGDIFPVRTYLLVCPSCNSALIAESHEELRDEGTGWSRPVRVYPRPKRTIGNDIPPIVKSSLEEAEQCVQAGAYLAATAMCGRALEAICRHYRTKDNYLGGGLKELRDLGVIEARLFQWGEELRDQRNNAAHATDTEISARDCNDVMIFTYAIVDYVFLLANKFEDFQKRKIAREAKKKVTQNKHERSGTLVTK